jgi:hypothetical protein
LLARWRLIFCRAACRQRADAYPEQAQLAIEWHAPQAFAGGAADGLRIVDGGRQGQVAGDGLEVGEAQLDAYRPALVVLAAQVFGDARAQCRENCAQFRAIVAWMQVALESRFAADRFRLGRGAQRSFVDTVRGGEQPAAIAAAEVML